VQLRPTVRVAGLQVRGEARSCNLWNGIGWTCVDWGWQVSRVL
jgi:hypothetical protein